MALLQHIDIVQNKLAQLVQEKSEVASLSVYSPFEGLDCSTLVEDISISYDAAIPHDELENDDEVAQELAKFNKSASESSKLFVLHAAVSREIDNDLSDLDTLASLLDVLIHLAKHADYYSSNDFFQDLGVAIERLLRARDTRLLQFWTYMETRTGPLQEHVFNAAVTLHRIALLGICNSVTDTYYSRHARVLDSYKKDTFNDRLHGRVRTFLASMLQFDDLTGLNKFFAVAGRVSREPNVGPPKTGDDELLEDVLGFHHFLRRPNEFFKDKRALTRQVDSMTRLADYLTEEESKYAKKFPLADPYAPPPEYSDAQKAALIQKYRVATFYAENYWLSPFEATKSGKSFEEVKRADKLTAFRLFDSSKHRRLLLIQLYLLCAFLLSISLSKKRDTLKEIGLAASAKHITDDVVPESVVSVALRIRKTISLSSKSWDNQLYYLLAVILNGEELWVQWLLNSKDAEGKSLLGKGKLSSADLEDVERILQSLYPLKEKRYFNSHGTPQLSRRMKTATGLELLRGRRFSGSEFDDRIAQLTSDIQNESDPEKRSSLIDDKTLVVWRKLNQARQLKWLDFGALLSETDIEDPDEKASQARAKEAAEREEDKILKEEEEIQKKALDDEKNSKSSKDLKGTDEDTSEPKKSDTVDGDGPTKSTDEVLEDGEEINGDAENYSVEAPSRTETPLPDQDNQVSDKMELDDTTETAPADEISATDEVNEPAKEELQIDKDVAAETRLNATADSSVGTLTRKRRASNSDEEEAQNSARKAPRTEQLTTDLVPST